MAVPEKASAGNFLDKLVRFFKESKVELKKVTWPTRQELIVNTIVVLVAVAFVACLIWIMDSIFSVIIRAIIG